MNDCFFSIVWCTQGDTHPMLVDYFWHMYEMIFMVSSIAYKNIHKILINSLVFILQEDKVLKGWIAYMQCSSY
jgi:hypothetical protein